MPKRVQCPHCHEWFYPGECRIVAKLPYKTKYVDINPGDVMKRPSPLAMFHSEPLTGPLYTRTQAVRQCPHCDHDLPRNIDIAKSYTIAIVGDGTSGKSHYIASCINQLQQAPALQVIGCGQIIGQGDTDDRYINEYYAPIYGNKIKVEASQQRHIEPPLVYELIFPDKSVNLMFYDSSGEDMVDQTRLVQYSNYILNASAIIFLADPLSMPKIRNVVPTHLLPPGQRALNPATVLNRITETFRYNNSVSNAKKLRIPVAITISKSDLLEFAVTNASSLLYLKENVLPNRFDSGHFDAISKQVQDVLYRLGDQVLLKSSQSFENMSFFAVSATGWTPDKDGKFPAIEPKRCLDPLLWSLWKLGIIYDG